MPTISVRPKRVAAYARVSTNSEEQLTSYEAQVKHYTEYIKCREHTDNWQFVSVYTDRGITGTSTVRREGFNRMMQDALAGKIDLIITKSVSRFARNTVDTLTAIRKLKEHGVEVYFEEQNIYTLDGKGELLLTIMSSIAQEESRNISENVTWGIRKRFADGKVSMPYKRFMGYRRGEKGIPEIVEAEAKIVRGIFRRFLEGATSTMIAKELNGAGIPCPARKSQLGEDETRTEKDKRKIARWSPSTVESILTNEKYKGDAILQKTYCTDYIQKTFVVNDGSEIPKYYAQNSHPAIVSAEMFDLTQMELEWRRSLKGSYYGIASLKTKMQEWDEWLRHRIRAYIWKQWKKPKTKQKNLMKLGVPEYYAHMAANSRRGYWFTVNTGAVKRGITNERLTRAGFFELSPAYESIQSACTGRAVYRTVRTVR